MITGGPISGRTHFKECFLFLSPLIKTSDQLSDSSTRHAWLPVPVSGQEKRIVKP